MVTFQIVLSAKTVAEALAMQAELVASGASVAPLAVGNAGDKGEHETSYLAKYGATRLTSGMVATFDLKGTREEQFSQFKALRDSGKVIKTATGYKWSGDTGAIDRSTGAGVAEKGDVDTTEIEIDFGNAPMD